MINLPEEFGTYVFNEKVMQQRLPKDAYQAVKKTIRTGAPLDASVAAVVANAMRDWAMEKGATHYTHWFQPMTGITAEKHDSFLSPISNSQVIMEFKGKELIKGEPDASSFPSGGLRATFEARGYTTWDPTSFAFVKDGSLCVPTVFCSFSGQVLDKKTPLLRSMEKIDVQAKRILKLFGKDTPHVESQVGAEQEYFLIDKKLYDTRPDLIFTGRTLFGAKPPKGQELEDHYFGSIKTRVSAYMKDLDEELWRLGIFSKTKHNEAAPAQHEVAPVFSTANIATDQNQLMMETMKKVAERHNLVCLLHEKPFEGVNGSGKHNNWSFSATGVGNLLDPGDSPQDNAQFLLFLCAVIKAVDEYQDLLRICIATAGNDHRLGANEAPPAIVSIFLGDELTSILEAVENGISFEAHEQQAMELGVTLLPKFPKDVTDRNRTSPFAFTGNKFEFRMPGSSQSIAGINFTINAIVAEALSQFADRLENAADFNKELTKLLQETIKKHKRIIFNGNGYDDEWVKEAEKRGLSNFKTTVDALPHFVDKKNIEVFEKQGILSETEMYSRYEILTETYSKVINIEALSMLEIAKREILPASIAFSKSLAESVAVKTQIGVDTYAEKELVSKTSSLCGELSKGITALEKAVAETKGITDILKNAQGYCYNVIPAMNYVREVADTLETLVGADYWPLPTYSELLFNL